MRVPVHGPILGEEEDNALMQVVKRRWYTEGKACAEFERKLELFTGRRDAILCNSGSSANLLAISALINPGDHVITTALNFPTTLNPIIQNRGVPVLIDVEIPSMVPTVDMVADAITPKTRGVVLAHTLGHPVDPAIKQMCKELRMWYVDDCCDALGSPDTMMGDASTLSFYPAHHITTGEGGAVLVDDPKLARKIRSLRDWGKDCWCAPGEDGRCGMRFVGDYDHKYTFSQIGYNLKMTDFQGALGSAQIDRLPGFIRQRKINHADLRDELVVYQQNKHFILPPNVYHSWFGFALICREHVQRKLLIQYLEAHGIQTRLIMGGNLTRQPAYRGVDMIIPDKLTNTDIIHERAFWVGCHPGIEQEHIKHIVNSIVEYTTYLGVEHD